MRFSASSDFLAAARGASKIVTWSSWIRKTTSLSGSITGYTGWTESTFYHGPLSGIASRIEMSVGQHTTDSIGLSGTNIAWWKANAFNATASQYIELKIECKIGIGSTPTSDVVYAFNGIIRKDPAYNEIADAVQITAESLDTLLDSISAQALSTQYVNLSVDGAGTSGIVLPRIRGVYVTNAAVTSYNLKLGKHTITYKYNSGSPTAALDTGANTALPGSNGSVTLVSEDGLQKITLYVKVDPLITTADPITDYVIVTSVGTTLPSQPYYGLSVREMIKKIYAEVGITTVTFDTLAFASRDSTVRLGFLEYPPMNAAKTGARRAVCGLQSSANIVVAVGAELYQRGVDGSSTLLATISTGAGATTVRRMWHDLRNNYLYVLYSNATNGDCVMRFSSIGWAASSEVVLHATAGTINPFSIEWIDYNYTGTSYKTGLVYYYPENPAVIRFLNAGTMTSSAIVNAPAGVRSTQFACDFAFTYNASTKIFLVRTHATSLNFCYAVQVDSSGAWNVITPPSRSDSWPNYCQAAYHADEDRVYYWEYPGVSPANLKSHPVNGDGTTTVLTAVNWSQDHQAIWYDPVAEKVYTSVGDVYWIDSYSGTFYSIASNVATVLSTKVHVVDYPFTLNGNIAYGLDAFGRLFKIDSSISIWIEDRDYTDSTLRELLNSIFQAFNLIGKVMSTKAAAVYRRGDDDGDPLTSGYSITLDTTIAGDITQNAESYLGCGYVEVSNGEVTGSYDGTNYDAGVLVSTRSLVISNDLIPSSIILDLARYLYQFFSVSRTLYKVDLANTPLFQYEPFDQATLAFTTTKIQSSASGPIYGTVLGPGADMTIEVLV